MIRVLHYGLGPVGLNIVRRLAREKNLLSSAAVDINPALHGKSLAELVESKEAGLKRVRIAGKIAKAGAQVAIHTTSSWIVEIEDQVAALLSAGLHVVSTAEELIYPLPKYKKQIARLDRLAKRKRRAFVGVGVNPGFVLDLLPYVLSLASTGVERIEATRLVDLRTRRMQLQRKVGVGMSAMEFEANTKSERFGHQGMRESLGLLAAGLGWTLKRTYTSIAPVHAEEKLSTQYFDVVPGQVAGLEQVAIGYADGKERLRLTVRMVVPAEDASETAYDEIRIFGDPPIHVRILEGIAGEPATAAGAIKAIPRVMIAPPGFHTLLTLPINRGK